ncbi:hypothetical protein E2K99_22720 [Herbaspirillum huttiense]|uniref:hypothetical protein n=1 Tax=Herbaspirillum huttiense TaxID=863372 RepID=UPI001066486E|nr:hypothetical protein [Herbaspirillum huttiense]QBP77631.1 hypothetical protein E2K99_22720 [Herbaspirillum huttiense]
MIELIVETEPVFEHKGYWSMVVRCITDIKELDRFSTAVPYKAEFVDEGTCLKTIFEPGVDVDLVVDKIHSYDREWNIVSEGMTAKIFAIGDASKVRARSLLQGDLLSPRRIRETDIAKFKSRPNP